MTLLCSSDFEDLSEMLILILQHTCASHPTCSLLSWFNASSAC